MRRSFIQTILFTVLTIVSSTVQASRRSLHSSIKARKDWAVYNNASHEDHRPELVKRDKTKYIFMHHIVGNTYSYTVNDWKEDIEMFQSKGIDAVALNLGASSWQVAQIQNAYDAAQQLGTGVKLFLSFDFTEIPCALNNIVSLVNRFANHPSQFKYNGKVFISSFSGDCLGNGGWQNLKDQTNGYLMPFIWGLENQFKTWNSLDSWYCWGCAWPSGNFAKTTDDDNFYVNQLGSRYATTVSGWMYAHYESKNLYLRGDDWLLVNRWEQLVSMRNQLTFVEMVTWNDFGESDYFGPFKGDQPASTTWADNFPHTAWFDLSAYYITAFKTGTYPPITKDVIYFWARPHPASASASGDDLAKPSGWDWTQDTMWAAVFATGPATVVLTCGSSTRSFTVKAGVNKLSIPLAPGKMTVQMIRSGQKIIDYTPDDYTFITNPVTYNYNAWVGSASATNSPTTTFTLSLSPLGCIAEGTTGSRRALTGASFNQMDMTPQKCRSLCSGFSYAGVEAGTECYCGNSLTNNGATGTVIASSECNVNCMGDATQKCGGSWKLNVFKMENSASPVWDSAGCYTDASTRILRGSFVQQSGMTTETCQNICASAGHTMAATEYGKECYCGSQFFRQNGAGSPVDASQCSMPCDGNSGKSCGGPWRANVYLTNGTTI